MRLIVPLSAPRVNAARATLLIDVRLLNASVTISVLSAWSEGKTHDAGADFADSARADRLEQ